MAMRHASLHGHRSRSQRWVWLLGVLILLASIVMVGVSLLRGSEATATDDLRHALAEPVLFDAKDAIEPAAPPKKDYPAATLAAPEASLEVPLVDTGRNADGDLAIPSAELAGVFTESAALSADAGSTLVAGHVADGLGVFAPMAQLALLNAGDAVVTVDAEGLRTDWVVVSSTMIPRVGLPEEMWQKSGERKLVLVTCAGPTRESNGGIHFTENLVVTAVPRADITD